MLLYKLFERLRIRMASVFDAGGFRARFVLSNWEGLIMKNVFLAAAVALLLVAGVASAKTIKGSLDAQEPGIDAEGNLDLENIGSSVWKYKVNPANGAFSAKGKGTAPNASGEKVSGVEFPRAGTLDTPAGTVFVEATEVLTYAKPKSGTSKLKVKLAGEASPL